MVLKVGGGGPDTLTGTNARDTLDGRGGADRLSGLLGNDVLLGGAGADRLNGGVGNDSMNGGTGDDTFVVDSAGDKVIEQVNAGTDTVETRLSFVLGSNVENLVLKGSANLNGTGNALANVIGGNSGRNTLVGKGGNDELNGGGGSDRLQGDDGDDSLNGGAGNDSLVGGAGNDTYLVDAGDTFVEAANAGTDTLVSSIGRTLGANFENLTLTGAGALNGTGNGVANVLTGNGAANTLSGLGGGDSLIGLGGNDRLIGGDGADLLNGGGGNDRMIGGAGNDTFVVGQTGDVVTELAGQGTDTVQSSIAFTLGNNVENLTLTGADDINGAGNAADNLITGNTGANRLAGADGNDRLNGGDGDDSLVGGAGNDTLNGGDGDDRLVGGTGNDVLNGGAGDGDTAVFGGFLVDFTVTQGAQTTVTDNVGAAGTDTLTNVENLAFGDLNLDLSGTNPIAFIRLDQLSGKGFRLNGIDAGDGAGNAVAGAGDFNGDGLLDYIIGAREAAGAGAGGSGEVYIVFGSTGGANIDLALLDGTNGFRLNGVQSGDAAGVSVSGAGDINGDGIDDVVIGAYLADHSGLTNAGEVYVVFGSTDPFAATFSLAPANLDGTNGFTIRGFQSEDRVGFSVSVIGDVNGDGIADILIGATETDAPAGQVDPDPGEAYVVFGSSTAFGGILDLSTLDGDNGFKLEGDAAFDVTGFSVGGGGDVNGDGFDDFVIGAPGSDTLGYDGNGRTFVVLGKAASFGASVDLGSLGADGFQILGRADQDASGSVVRVIGDWNGDTIDDLLVTSFLATPGGLGSAGEAYVVFGSETIGGGGNIALANLDGTDGFRIQGTVAQDFFGGAAASAGDVNGDGFDDIIVGALGADALGGVDAGRAFVIFGGTNFGATGSASLADLTPDLGFRIDGINAEDVAGGAVSGAGDINGDGFDDIVVGAPFANAGGDVDSGQAFVIFGKDFRRKVDDDGTAGNDNLVGAAGSQILIGGRGDDTLDGGAGNDVLIGGAGNDRIVFDAADALRVDGCRGTDTLVVNADLNLTTYNQTAHFNVLRGFERVDLDAGGDAVTLTLDVRSLLRLSESSNTLRVDGDASDAVATSDTGWGAGAAGTGDLAGYTVYTNGEATLAVDSDIVQTGIQA